jgi:hypothetical protein
MNYAFVPIALAVFMLGFGRPVETCLSRRHRRCCSAWFRRQVHSCNRDGRISSMMQAPLVES